MLIKLQFIAETDKAYQLPGGGWIPKSVLDSRGLNAPFYTVQDWFITKTMEKAYNKDISSRHTLASLSGLIIKFRDLPEEVMVKWRNYWASCDSGGLQVDYEPRLWGNDCFEGSMSDWF